MKKIIIVYGIRDREMWITDDELMIVMIGMVWS